MRAVLLLLALCGLLVGCAAPAQPQPQQQLPAAAAAPSVPVRIEIPALGVASQLLRLGVDAERQPAVPPETQPDVAAWSTWSPRPGEPGPATIIGHVSGTQGPGGPSVPGVFADLPELQPGDTVSVWRADGTRVVFGVERVEQYPKTGLPIDEVWGDTDGPELRLVTCSGRYDPQNRRFLDQTVAYATAAS